MLTRAASGTRDQDPPPAIEVALALILEFVPADKDKLANGIVIAEANVNAICAKVNAVTYGQVPIPYPGTP